MMDVGQADSSVTHPPHQHTHNEGGRYQTDDFYIHGGNHSKNVFHWQALKGMIDMNAIATYSILLLTKLWIYIWSSPNPLSIHLASDLTDMGVWVS